MKIGVLADTHGLLRPQVLEIFNGVDRIVHAGDVGSAEILTELQGLAAVHAVYGNCDRFPLTEQLNDREIIDLEGIRTFITHIGGKPKEIRQFYPDVHGARLVIFGHSHRASRIEDEGTLFFNPGAAGPRRFSLRPSIGLIEIRDGRLETQIVEIG